MIAGRFIPAKFEFIIAWMTRSFHVLTDKSVRRHKKHPSAGGRSNHFFFSCSNSARSCSGTGNPILAAFSMIEMPSFEM